MHRPTEIGVRQLEAEAANVLRRVEAGHEVVITRRGVPIAVISSAPAARRAAPASDSLFERLRRWIAARTPTVAGRAAARQRRNFTALSSRVAKRPYEPRRSRPIAPGRGVTPRW